MYVWNDICILQMGEEKERKVNTNLSPTPASAYHSFNRKPTRRYHTLYIDYLLGRLLRK